ncbi:hypothetical protein WKI71_28280 [Streptomyces sp. MS1.AVA.1]|uniref:Uncharacterized protein n=1 Tax=Streptomyces machairae TaxID=3134109 RepID=A0ABU8UPQ7_9ACTN
MTTDATTFLFSSSPISPDRQRSRGSCGGFAAPRSSEKTSRSSASSASGPLMLHRPQLRQE